MITLLIIKQGKQQCPLKLNYLRLDSSHQLGSPIEMLAARVNKKNNLLQVIPKMTPSYSVKFDFNPSRFQGGWTNILHLTTGANCCGYGDRIPAVWFHGSHTSATKNRLHICSAVNGKGNYCVDSGATVARGCWTTIEITQLPEGVYYRYTVKVAGTVLRSVINKQPREFVNVRVMSADAWHNAAQGSIRNLVIHPKVLGMYL